MVQNAFGANISHVELLNTVKYMVLASNTDVLDCRNLPKSSWESPRGTKNDPEVAQIQAQAQESTLEVVLTSNLVKPCPIPLLIGVPKGLPGSDLHHNLGDFPPP